MTAGPVLVFGGTFDPPHRAHVELPAAAARALDAPLILYVPASISPHKLERPPTPPEHRLAMLRLALDGRSGVEIDTIEIERGGPSYTCETLERLTTRRPGQTLRLLIGSDQAVTFDRWREWERIVALAEPAVMLRAPTDRDDFAATMRPRWTADQVDEWLARVVAVPPVEVSATEVRRALAAGEACPDVDPAVAEYAVRHQIYAGLSSRPHA